MKKYIIAAAVFVASNAIAGPLGLSKGLTLEELMKQGPFTPGSEQFTYKSKTIAKGHPDFESYMAVLTPNQGLCKIVAVSKDIDSSSFGTELERKYKDMIGAMTEKYGAPGSNFDYLQPGSIWKEPKYWMMGLLKKERSLKAYWIPPEITNLPDSISTIYVEALALSGSNGIIRIGYEFDNINECLDFLKSKKNSNL